MNKLILYNGKECFSDVVCVIQTEKGKLYKMYSSGKFDQLDFTDRVTSNEVTPEVFIKAVMNDKQHVHSFTPYEYFYFATTFKEPKKIELKLNDNTFATIDKNKIVVGCQTFDIGIIDKLVAVRNELNKE